MCEALIHDQMKTNYTWYIRGRIVCYMYIYIYIYMYYIIYIWRIILYYTILYYIILYYIYILYIYIYIKYIYIYIYSWSVFWSAWPCNCGHLLATVHTKRFTTNRMNYENDQWSSVKCGTCNQKPQPIQHVLATKLFFNKLLGKALTLPNSTPHVHFTSGYGSIPIN